MAAIKNTNEIVQSLIDFYKTVKPNLNTNPGSYTNDIFITPLASQLSLLYDELSSISSKQSLRLLIGSDLDKFAKNFGISRSNPTPSSGFVVATFNSLSSNFSIRKNDSFTSTNGVSFSSTSNVAISISNSNYYKSIALKYKNDLDFLSITDQYAIEVPVVCNNPGVIGNVPKYSISKTNIVNIKNCINPNEFRSGSDQQNDASFRDSILSVFSGSSVGTALGYLNATISVSGVLDAFVVEPGNALMTRDGTVVNKLTDGSLEIVSEGSGGKVDVIVLGNTTQETFNSFIYLDKSNQSDSSNSKNDYTLGQISGDESKSIKRRRKDNLSSGVLPTQPISSISKVSGSLSGSNFKEKTIDQYGKVSGNYELIKDTGYYQGSPWSLDKLHWISNKISNYQEDHTKNQIYGQDQLNFTGVERISSSTQQVQILNENSKVTSDRSYIQLLHYPVTSVTRVFNLNTGERYVVSNQNPDGSGLINNTGRIKISGSTLPTQSDVLQVDYSWLVTYDQHLDFDGLSNTSNIRSVSDSIDWGYSANVRDEKIKFTLDASGDFYSGKTLLPINTVVSCIKYDNYVGKVSKVTSGAYVDRLSIILTNLNVLPSSVHKIFKLNTKIDVYNTSTADYTFTSASGLFGINTVYNLTIILPSDTTAKENDYVDIYLNGSDVFSVDNTNGSFSNFEITLPASNTDSSTDNLYLLVNYICSAQNSINTNVTSLPNSLYFNGLFNSYSEKNTNSLCPVFSESLTVKTNTDLDLYVELSLTNDLFELTTDSLITVVHSTNGNEYWNSSHLGTVSISDSGKYQLILSGFNSPTDGDVVAVVCLPKQILRFQPITRQASNERYQISSGINSVDILTFQIESAIEFEVFNLNDGYTVISGLDGYIDSNSQLISEFSSSSYLFSSLDNVKNYGIKLNGTLNKGKYKIFDFDSLTDRITIGEDFSQLSKNNFGVFKVANGKEVEITSINLNTGKLLINNITANVLSPEKFIVVSYTNDIIRNASSRLNISISDQVVNQGVIGVSGNTIYKAENIVFTQIYNDYKVNLSEALRKALGKNSSYSLPSNIKIVNVCELSKVTTNGSVVLSELNKFNLDNIKVKDNSYFNIEPDSSLSSFDVLLNTGNENTNNKPSIGDKMMVSFYYVIENDTESLLFSRNSSLFTNKKFATIKKIYPSSGFKSSLSTKINVSLFNQPSTNSRYTVVYDYTAPKQNERITVNYLYNKLISDVQLNLETKRPINADLLVKESSIINIGVSVLIFIDSTSGLSSTTVEQNVRNAITSVVNVLQLGRTLDDIDISNAVDKVSGVLKSKILYFNRTGYSGSVSKIVSQSNEYFQVDTITITSEIR